MNNNSAFLLYDTKIGSPIAVSNSLLQLGQFLKVLEPKTSSKAIVNEAISNTIQQLNESELINNQLLDFNIGSETIYALLPLQLAHEISDYQMFLTFVFDEYIFALPISNSVNLTKLAESPVIFDFFQQLSELNNQIDFSLIQEKLLQFNQYIMTGYREHQKALYPTLTFTDINTEHTYQLGFVSVRDLTKAVALNI